MNLLGYLSKEELERVQIKSLKKGETLYIEGDLCEAIGIVLLGELKISSFLENGKEVIYNDIKEGQVFGNNLVFSSDPYYRGDIVVKKNSKIAIINKETLLKLLQSNQSFLLAYLNIQSNFGKQLNSNIKLLTFNNARDRILYYLQINKNRVSIKSISDLANKLFLTREATSREIHKLMDEKIIIYKAKEIVKI